MQIALRHCQLGRSQRVSHCGRHFCLTQKELADEMDRIFLINRTEHPRLAEKVRCLCVGRGVTWGPPCQALVTRLPADRRQRVESNRPTQNNSSKANNTAHNRFYVVRREAYVHGRSKESFYWKRGIHTQDLSSLLARKEKVT